MQHKPNAKPPPLGLALQGGGSFGAFTWGVLDRLLAEPTLPLAAISGASAGAVNAVVLAERASRASGACCPTERGSRPFPF